MIWQGLIFFGLINEGIFFLTIDLKDLSICFVVFGFKYSFSILKFLFTFELILICILLVSFIKNSCKYTQ